MWITCFPCQYYVQPCYSLREQDPIPQYPSVDAGQLILSAHESKKLMKEVGMVIDHLAASEEFGTALMTAAQASDTEEVKRLVQSLEIESDVDIQYNPDSIRLEFNLKTDMPDCCTVSIALRWR